MLLERANGEEDDRVRADLLGELRGGQLVEAHVGGIEGAA
jgi:hypothetical protein